MGDNLDEYKKLSRRVNIALLIVPIVLLLGFAYYGYGAVTGNYNKSSGDPITVQDWNNLDDDFAGGIGTPDWDSGWVKMSSQSGSAARQVISHPLGAVPTFWYGLVRRDGTTDNVGSSSPFYDATFIVGQAQTTDDDDGYIDESDFTNYGGSVIAFTTDNVLIALPTVNNHSELGRVISVLDGWGQNGNEVAFQNVEIRILAWR